MQNQLIEYASNRSPILFEDRTDAGKKLSKLVAKLNYHIDQYIAIPMGGIPVAMEFESTRELLLCPSKKITHSKGSIFGIGALDIFGNPLIDNKNQFISTNIDEMISQARLEQLSTISKVTTTRCNMKGLDGKKVAIIDDGISTGYTMMAAISSLLFESKPSNLYCISPVISAHGLHNIISVYPDVIFVGIYYSTDKVFIVDSFYNSFERVSM